MADKDGIKRTGQQYDAKNNVILKFIRWVTRYSNSEDNRTTLSDGATATEINPIDDSMAEVTEFDVAGIQAILDARFFSFPGKTSSSELQIPPELTAIEVVYNTQSGSGESLHPASQQAWLAYGGSGSGGLNPRSTAQGSASVIPDLVFTYREVWSNNISVTHYMLFMPESYTEAELLARLTSQLSTTVTSWPTFKPEAVNFSVQGMSVSIQQSADSNAQVSFGSGVSGSREWGGSYSSDNSLTNKSVRLPPMIHGALTITSPTSSLSTTVDVEASTIQIWAYDADGVQVFVDAINNNPSPISATAIGSVSPTSLSATSPAAVPTTGLYIYDINNDPFGYGRILVRASVINAATIAP